ncbi:glycosyltransferase family 4 protein [Flavobacterium magnesitis]|uniref:glycosyltransferase family 4 protein n=1 Tax=Flavobacterium magnesitis TaxID=3138077 RepID=UPI00358E2BEB
MKKSLVFIHLFNGFTGSPNVLATILNGLNTDNYDTTVLTSFNNKGFLSDVNCTRQVNISYYFKQNKIFRLFQFIKFQFFAAIFILGTSKKDIIFLNTIQPFLPAIIAKLKGNKVIFHIHEAYSKKTLFTNFLFYIIQVSSDEIICVSEYVLNQLNPKSRKKASLIYNSLPVSFVENRILEPKKDSSKNILMVSSPKKYKGIFQFCNLAGLLNEYNFVLVCDATKEEIEGLFSSYSKINNLQIVGSQKNLHPFYSEADLIVNFSIPNQIVETFGLTILEGMTYGLPCVVPPVGGITELVDEGVNGYKVDCRETWELANKIRLILDDDLKYKEMSNEAIKKSKKFSFDVFINKIKLKIG